MFYSWSRFLPCFLLFFVGKSALSGCATSYEEPTTGSSETNISATNAIFRDARYESIVRNAWRDRFSPREEPRSYVQHPHNAGPGTDAQGCSTKDQPIQYSMELESKNMAILDYYYPGAPTAKNDCRFVSESDWKRQSLEERSAWVKNEIFSDPKKISGLHWNCFRKMSSPASGKKEPVSFVHWSEKLEYEGVDITFYELKLETSVSTLWDLWTAIEETKTLFDGGLHVHMTWVLDPDHRLNISNPASSASFSDQQMRFWNRQLSLFAHLNEYISVNNLVSFSEREKLLSQSPLIFMRIAKNYWTPDINSDFFDRVPTDFLKFYSVGFRLNKYPDVTRVGFEIRRQLLSDEMRFVTLMTTRLLESMWGEEKFCALLMGLGGTKCVDTSETMTAQARFQPEPELAQYLRDYFQKSASYRTDLKSQLIHLTVTDESVFLRWFMYPLALGWETRPWLNETQQATVQKATAFYRERLQAMARTSRLDRDVVLEMNQFLVQWAQTSNLGVYWLIRDTKPTTAPPIASNVRSHG